MTEKPKSILARLVLIIGQSIIVLRVPALFIVVFALSVEFVHHGTIRWKYNGALQFLLRIIRMEMASVGTGLLFLHYFFRICGSLLQKLGESLENVSEWIPIANIGTCFLVFMISVIVPFILAHVTHWVFSYYRLSHNRLSATSTLIPILHPVKKQLQIYKYLQSKMRLSFSLLPLSHLADWLRVNLAAIGILSLKYTNSDVSQKAEVHVSSWKRSS